MVYGVTINNNEIGVTGGSKKNIDFGIFLSGAKNNVIKSNTVNLNSHDHKSEGKGFGIRALNGNNNDISYNKVYNCTNAGGTGIAVGKDITSGKVNNNIISNMAKNGIRIHQGAKVSEVNKNTITKTKDIALSVIESGSKVTSNIYANKITGGNSSKNAIHVENAYVKSISTNTIKGAVQTGVKVRGSKGSVGTIYKNTITATSSNSIAVDTKGSVTGSIKNNKITGTKNNFGIYCADAKKIASITGNSISTKKQKNKILLPKKTTIYSKNYTIKRKKSFKIWHGGPNPKWSSSNKKIAKIDKNGKVTALKKKGKVTITATSGGAKVKMTVTVK